jgi:hypothetical protein
MTWFFEISCSDWDGWYYITPWSMLIAITALIIIYGIRLYKKLSLFERKEYLEQSRADIQTGETGFY